MMEWQPIETAPKDGAEIILCRGKRVTCGAWVEEDEETMSEYHSNGTYLGEYPTGKIYPAYWMSQDGGFTDEEPPTHWMALPEPPKVNK